ncbi:MAG TPA: tetratricopeptide repeat protein [Planctomycetaceae bacterium]|jgi:tetratricopeptide (TPR) repeat protein|nr:tetratricopeptide repeat protein [Planctomycetaceae bacterium]
MDANKVPRTIRLLQRAEGYLELQLPVRAIAELDAIADAGPFEPAVALLRGEALKSQQRYDEALAPLKQAATMIPAPLNKRAWRSLSECYRQTGRNELAEIADMVINSEEAEPESQPDPQQVTIHFAVLPLALVNAALKMLFGGRGLGNPGETPDETPEDQTTAGE